MIFLLERSIIPFRFLTHFRLHRLSACEIGRDKRVLTEFVRISLDVSVGEAVSTLGNYIEYSVRAQEDLSPSLPVSVLPNAFTILMQGARNRTVLPDKWNNTNV